MSINIYWLWRAAEVVSGHDKEISKNYEKLAHMSPKESTAKWFVIFLIPTILGVLSMGTMAGGALLGGLGFGLAIAGVLWIVVAVIGIYILYKMAENVSGHETSYPHQYEVVNHQDRKDSTAKWFVFGIIPLLNLYFLWKMSETISGHETVFG